MAQDPAFLMYYGKWLNSTSGWDADIRGWYIDLLCHQADKPDGLPDDVEQLAVLAGVKFSQFERFKHSWKHTLECKFVKNNGLLINKKMEETILDRRGYSERQSLRGRIGYFIKVAKTQLNVPEQYLGEIAKRLQEENIQEKTKEESQAVFKRTLEALMIDINIDSISFKSTNRRQSRSSTKGVSFSEDKTEVLFSDGTYQKLGAQQIQAAISNNYSRPQDIIQGSTY